MNILLFLLLISIGILLRDIMVYRYRDKIIWKINGMEEWAVFRGIGYNTMMLKFWKPLKSFYTGTILEKYT